MDAAFQRFRKKEDDLHMERQIIFLFRGQACRSEAGIFCAI